MVHEGGHAVHSFLTAPLELNEFRNFPSEVAELASMSMELLTMEHWKAYFPENADLSRAREEHLEDILRTLPWVACVDCFQHWLYTHPNHSREERAQAWREIYGRFSGKLVSWQGYEEARDYLWHKQLHLFEVPFYYIEYGFAQLGAVAVWKNYLQNGAMAIEQYKQALSLGYTRSIADIYRAAGIKFDFSTPYITELMAVVSEKLKA
jgi:oligoendopeptidase F